LPLLKKPVLDPLALVAAVGVLAGPHATIISASVTMKFLTRGTIPMPRRC
jgi:hypothetical protein